MLGKLRIGCLLALVAVAATIGCGEKPFVSPEGALAEYIEAYNDGDTKKMAVCGDDADVRGLFTLRNQNLLGDNVVKHVKGIQFEVLGVDQRPRSTLSHHFLTEDAWVEAEFTSSENPEFRKVGVVRLVNRTNSYYIEEPHWQLVPLEGE